MEKEGRRGTGDKKKKKNKKRDWFLTFEVTYYMLKIMLLAYVVFLVSLRIICNSDISAALANCEMTTTRAILCDRNAIHFISVCESFFRFGT